MFKTQNFIKGVLFGLLMLTNFMAAAHPAMAMPSGPVLGEESVADRPALDWLSGWGYHRTVTITNTGAALTNYQVRVAVSSFTWANAKSDGSDVRLTSSDGTTAIPFWIECWNSSANGCASSASIWVKVPAIASGTTYIFLYYGNSSATSLSNGPNTFILFDNGWKTTLNPIQSAGQSWWEVDLTYPMVFTDSSASLAHPGYHMLYDGHKNPTYGESKGYAYSSDLTTWTEYDGGSHNPPTPNPIMGPAGYAGSANYAWGDTIKVGSTYHMFPYKISGTTAVHAKSTDLITWTNSSGITTTFDSLIPTNDPSGIGSGVAILKEADGITPIVVNNKYWMVYFHQGDTTGGMYLAYADTGDLRTWTTIGSPTPILLQGSSGWDHDGIWTPSFVRVNNTYYLYYQGTLTGTGWQLGFAKADASVAPNNATWTKSSSNPVVTKTHVWDQGGCQDPILRYFNGTYYLFYTGNGVDGKDRNGFATSSSPEGPWAQAGCPSDGCGPIWTKTGSPTLSGGVLSFASGQSIVSTSTYTSTSPNLVLGFRTLFRSGSDGTYKWGGFIAGSDAPFLVVEVAGTNLILAADNGGQSSQLALSSSYLGNFNVYEIAWLGTAAARAYMNHSTTPVVGSPLTVGVPAGPLPVQFANLNDGSNALDVDWVYLRQFRDPEPTLALGSETPTAVTLSSFNARENDSFANVLLVVGLALIAGVVTLTGLQLTRSR